MGVEGMTEKYVEVYSILCDVDKLSIEEYNQLASIYGSEIVDLVISDLIDENEEKIYSFEVSLSENVTQLEKNGSLKNFDIYCSDISNVPFFDADKNLEIMEKIYAIIQELEDLFLMFDFNDLNLSGIHTPWIIDRIDYCISKCHNLQILSRLRFLNDEYKKYRNMITEGNLGLVISIAVNYASVINSNFDDIIQNGNIGLMRAVEKYNPYKGTSFSTYAYYWIEQNIIRGNKKIKYLVKIPNNIIYDNHHMLEVRNQLSLELGRNVTNRELAEYTGKSLDDINLWTKIFLEPLSLNETLKYDEYEVNGLEITRSDLIVDDNASVFQQVANREFLDNMDKLLPMYLNEEELFVIRHHFGFGVADYTLSEIAKIFNMNLKHICYINSKAIKKLARKHKIRSLLVQ